MEPETTTSKDAPAEKSPDGVVLNGQQGEQAAAGDNESTGEEDFQDALAERQEESTVELSQVPSMKESEDNAVEASEPDTQPPINGEAFKPLKDDSETDEEDFTTNLPATQPFHDSDMMVDESTLERKQSVNSAPREAEEEIVKETDKTAPEANPEPLKPEDLDREEAEPDDVADTVKPSLGSNEAAAPPMETTPSHDNDEKQPAKDNTPKKESPRKESTDKAGSWTSNMESNASELMEAAEKSKQEEAKKPSRPESHGIKMAKPAKKKRPSKLMAAKTVLSANPDATRSPEYQRYLETKGKESSSVKEFIEFRNKTAKIELPQDEGEPKKPAAKPSGAKRPVQDAAAKPAKKVKKQKAPRPADGGTLAAAAATGGQRPKAEEIWSGPPDEPLEGGWPVGWTKKLFQRKSGATKDRADPYWYSPKLGKKFRSMTEVKKFMEALRQTGNDEEAAWRKFKSK